MKAKRQGTYDPLDFHHGMEQLEQAESLGDLSHRKSIIEIMLADLDSIGGNMADDLIDYVTELSWFDDAVDIQKLKLLHYELVIHWGSSTDYERTKAERWLKIVRPAVERDDKRQRGTQKPRKPKIDEWIAANIKKFPNKTRLAHWADVPGWISDQIEVDRFLKRVSKVRKNNKK